MKNITLLMAALLLSTSLLARDRFGRGRRGDRFDNGYNQPQKERIVLEFYDQHLRGQNTLFLKQEIKRNHRNINLQNMQLISVKLVAKSKQGRGRAALTVGQRTSYEQIVGGSPYDFNHGGNYSRVMFNNPSYNSLGKWQIQLRGNFKIKKVVVIVEKMRRRNAMIRLNLRGEHFRGQNIIKLKQRIKREQPNINLKEFTLRDVTLIAKSKMGHGKVTLLVGQDQSYKQIIGGSPSDFNYNGSFKRLMLRNPSYNSLGKWQIALRGNIKVKEIIVELQRKNRRW